MTKSQQEVAYLSDTILGFPELSVAVASEATPTSMGAINMALSGKMVNEIPESMSSMVGWWIVAIQDELPTSVRDSEEWRLALVEAAQTDRSLDALRTRLVADWVTRTLMAGFRPMAERHGLGEEWSHLLKNEDLFARPCPPVLQGAAYGIWFVSKISEPHPETGVIHERQMKEIAYLSVSVMRALFRTGVPQDRVWSSLDIPGILMRLSLNNSGLETQEGAAQ